MMSNNIITHTYENNLRIRSLLGNGGPGIPPSDGWGDDDDDGNDDGGNGSLEVGQIIIIIISVVIFLCCFCLAPDIRDYFYPYVGARAEQVDRAAQVEVRLERVHCSNSEDDVLQSIVDETDHTKQEQ